MGNNAKALKSGVWYTIANFVVKAMALITTPIFTRLLTKEQFGNYSNFYSWTSIAVIVIGMSMASSLISAKYDFTNRLEQYNYSVIWLSLFSTAIWAAILNIFSSFFTNLLEIRLLYINLMLLYCFFRSVVDIFQMSERFQYKYKRSVFIALALAVSTTGISVLLVLILRDRLTGRILGTVLPYVVIGLSLLFFFVKKGKKVDFLVWPYVLRICIPFVPHLLSLTLLNSVDRIMITKICGASDNALYSVAYSCGHMVTILMTSMNSAFSPWLGEQLHAEEYETIKKVSRPYIILYIVLAVFMMLLAPEILLILGGKAYLAAKHVMAPVAMGCICQFLYTLYVNIEQYKKKTMGMAVASIIAALLNYCLNLLFIPRFGYIAAAYTTLAGYLFLLLVHMFLVKKLRYSHVYDNRFVLILVVILLGITVGVNYLFDNMILRYIILSIFAALIAIALVVKRNVVMQMIRMIIRKT